MKRFPARALPAESFDLNDEIKPAHDPALADKRARDFKRQKQKEETERQARQFAIMCEQYGVPLFVREFEFRTGRDSKFDFAWPAFKIALEVEGAIFIGGAHNRPNRFAADLEKYNAAASAAWLVFRCAAGYKDIVRHRKSAKTGLPTPTPIYAVPALCTFTTLKMIRDAIEHRQREEHPWMTRQG